MTDPHATRILSSSSGTAPIPASNISEWFYGATHTGQVRANNEDRFLCQVARGLFIVADGMGGHAAGEEASRIATVTLSRALSASALRQSAVQKTLVDALEQANSEIIRQSQNNFQWRGMGSTAVVAVVQEATLYSANVGDSRGYVLRAGRLHQITRDHSVAAMLAEQQEITREEVRLHALRNRLTMCLGIHEEIEPDTLRLDLEPDDRVLLCSDGLWDMLSDEEIGHLLQLYAAPQEAVKALIQAANQAGGKDNITAIVLHPPLPASSAPPCEETEEFGGDSGDSEDTVILRSNADG